MNVAIVGYGKMGREIEKAARSRGLEVKSIIDPSHEGATHKEISRESLGEADVCIDFTHPDAVMENIGKMAALKKNMVIGTTGWHGRIDEARRVAEKNSLGLVYASNFSLGVNLFFRVIKNTAELMNKFDQYDVFGYEMHHNNKADSPSGTARSIAEILLRQVERKQEAFYDKLNRRIKPEELHFSSIRGGNIPGTHVVGFDSVADTIELKHQARNREGFAMGAVLAAEWIHDKKGFYSIENMMDEIIGG